MEIRLISFYLTLAFLLNSQIVHSLYFHIKETERKCFIEEVPDETLVVGKIFLEMLPISNQKLTQNN
jgi:hypothetical protein